MDVISGYLEWPQTYYIKTRLLIYNYTDHGGNTKKMIANSRTLHKVHRRTRTRLNVIEAIELYTKQRERQPKTFIDILKNDCDCE